MKDKKDKKDKNKKISKSKNKKISKSKNKKISKSNNKIYIGVLVVVVAVFGTSIFYANQLERIVEEIIIAPYPEQPNLDYELPSNHPNIFVNQSGYEIGSEMSAIFQGGNGLKSFEVVDSNTKQVVYRGELSPLTSNIETDLSIGIFSSVIKEGEYYIRADYIGQSYPFWIHDKVQEDLFKSTYYATLDRIVVEDSLVAKVDLAIPILVAYEFYPMNFTDDTGIEDSGNKIPDMLDVLYIVAKEIEELVDAQLELEVEEQYKISGFLAKFGMLYESYDSSEGSKYMRLGHTIWSNILDQEESMSRYFAACELYRSLGGSQYHNVVKEYKSIEVTDYDEDSIYKLYGDLSYLQSNRSTDWNYCNALMEERIERTLSIATNVREMDNLALGIDEEQMLYNSFELIIIIQVLVSHEYRTMLEDQLTYFGGVNSEGMNYIEQIKDAPFFLLMMCDMIT